MLARAVALRRLVPELPWCTMTRKDNQKLELCVPVLVGASAASPTLVVKTENCLYVYIYVYIYIYTRLKKTLKM